MAACPLFQKASIRRLNVLVLIVIFYGFCHTSLAQYSATSLNLDRDVNQWFDHQIGKENAGLVHGHYQAIIRANYVYHPFYGSDHWVTGQVYYRNKLYENVALMYNILEDYLIIQHPTNLALRNQPIRLEENWVDYFTIAKHIFKYIDTGHSSITPGYYEELYKGKTLSVILKREKTASINSSNKLMKYTERSEYFIGRKENYYRIRGVSTYFKLFKPHKKELKAYIKAKGLIIGKDRDMDLVQLTKYCERMMP